MPELPEVECVRRGLEGVLVGRCVRRAVLQRRDVLRIGADDVASNAAGVACALLEGHEIDEVRRHGKQIAIVGRAVGSGGAWRTERVPRALVVHLGMSGQVRWHGEDAQPEGRTHVHATWWLGDRAQGKPRGETGGDVMVFRDPRRFGGLWALESLEDLAERWSELGPDALGIDGEVLRERLGESGRAIKAALLDQRVLAGVGNIYADEALYRAGIVPGRRVKDVSKREAGVLARAVSEVLAEAIEAGGTTLRDYRGVMGGTGSYQSRRSVYGRGGEPCVKCGDALASGTIAQRTTTWCERCQR